MIYHKTIHIMAKTLSSMQMHKIYFFKEKNSNNYILFA